MQVINHMALTEACEPKRSRVRQNVKGIVLLGTPNSELCSVSFSGFRDLGPCRWLGPHFKTRVRDKNNSDSLSTHRTVV